MKRKSSSLGHARVVAKSDNTFAVKYFAKKKECGVKYHGILEDDPQYISEAMVNLEQAINNLHINIDKKPNRKTKQVVESYIYRFGQFQDLKQARSNSPYNPQVKNGISDEELLKDGGPRLVNLTKELLDKIEETKLIVRDNKTLLRHKHKKEI